jgi:glycerophosphoryl diester phosphodiesterase
MCTVGRMQILGHRGSVHPTAPENTLAAIERALRQGADGVEIDVRVTADGIPVCHHDASLERTAADRRLVAMTPYAELPWIGSHPLPRLSEVVDLVTGRGRLVVEMKSPGWPALEAPESVSAVAAVLRRHRLGHVTVSSFDRLRLRAFRSLGLGCPTALIGRPAVPLLGLVRQATQDGHPEAHPHVSSVLAHPQHVPPGLRTTSWTVNRPEDLATLRDLGLDGVITDDPAAARAVLQPSLAVAG